MKHSMLINKVGDNYELYITDLSGFVVSGKSKEEILDIIREAIEIYLESMGEEGISIPDPMLEQDGWILIRIRGSHRQFKHPKKPGTVTVAGKPNLDVPPGTLNSIFKQSGLKK